MGHFSLSQNLFAFLMCFNDRFHHFCRFRGKITCALAFCAAYTASGNGCGHLRERAGALDGRNAIKTRPYFTLRSGTFYSSSPTLVIQNRTFNCRPAYSLYNQFPLLRFQQPLASYHIQLTTPSQTPFPRGERKNPIPHIHRTTPEFIRSRPPL